MAYGPVVAQSEDSQGVLFGLCNEHLQEGETLADMSRVALSFSLLPLLGVVFAFTFC